MNWVILAALIVIMLFSFVIAFGAPFLPTLKARTTEALDLLDLQPGELLLELGCGDGRILREAARRGIRSVGYELNPLLVIYAKLRALKYGGLIKVKWGNYWNRHWPPADGIYVFLLNPYMAKLNTKITQEISKKVKVVSFAFTIPGRKPVKEHNGLMLYIYNK
jgi:SAM-dependent methyltransferase